MQRPSIDSEDEYRCNSDNSVSEGNGATYSDSSNSNVADDVVRKSAFRIASRSTIESRASTGNSRFSSMIQNLRHSLSDILFIPSDTNTNRNGGESSERRNSDA